MAYIYKIYNDINNKIYVGKTNRNIKTRFQEHLYDSFATQSKTRPLYNAIKKYGKEHFFIESIEQCSSEESSEREKFWIQKYNSYYQGYNATLGGEGTTKINYNLVFSLWEKGFTIKEISRLIDRDRHTISDILTSFGVTSEDKKKRAAIANSKQVAMLDENENILFIFMSQIEAYKFLNKRPSDKISAVCRGERKSAYGYKWKFI